MKRARADDAYAAVPRPRRELEYRTHRTRASSCAAGLASIAWFTGSTAMLLLTTQARIRLATTPVELSGSKTLATSPAKAKKPQDEAKQSFWG